MTLAMHVDALPRVPTTISDLAFRAPAKRRILETVIRLFTEHGIRGIGVDRIIAESSVTKSTFYKHYRSKDLLVLAYLDTCHDAVRVRLESTENAGLLGYVDAVVTEVRGPDFHGCPFLTAATEFTDPLHPVRARVLLHREWLAEQFEQRLRSLGHSAPGDDADDLMLAIDGAMAGGPAGDPIAAAAALDRTARRVLRGPALSE